MRPVAKLDATLQAWGNDQTVYRVHPDIYPPDQFNPSSLGSARFSPLTISGSVIPTLYAGTTLNCALMETVFHDVPYAAGPKMLSKARHVTGRSHSSLRFRTDLTLVDLSTVSLRRLGISRPELIDTDASHYGETRKWAVALHEQYPAAQGLKWTSRQDDTATALVLFGDRVDVSAFELTGGPVSLLQPDGSACSEVLDLATRLGVYLV